MLKMGLFLVLLLNFTSSYAEIIKYFHDDGFITYSSRDVYINSDEFKNPTKEQLKEYFDLYNQPMIGWTFKDGGFIRTGKIIKKEKLTLETFEQSEKRAEELAAKESEERILK